MEERKNAVSNHKVIIEGRDKILVSGVEDVESFDDDKVIAYTVEGIMTVKGEGFHINRLNVDSGELEIEGLIDCIEYQDGGKSSSGSFLSKIFR